MANVIVLDGANTTLTLNGHVFTSFTEGDYLSVTWSNPKTSKTQAADGGVNVKGASNGDVAVAEINIQPYGTDDIFLNSQFNQATPVIFNGSAKTNLLRDGVDAVETITFEVGTFGVNAPSVKNNTDGEEKKSYSLDFNSAVRSL